MKTRLFITFIIIWLLVPTGTPDDVITFAIIALIGLELYVFFLLLVILGLWYYNISYAKMRKYTGDAKKEMKKRLKI